MRDENICWNECWSTTGTSSGDSERGFAIIGAPKLTSKRSKIADVFVEHGENRFERKGLMGSEDCWENISTVVVLLGISSKRLVVTGTAVT